MRSTLARIAESNRLLRWLGVAWFVTNFGEWAYVTALSIYGFREYGALVVGLVGARFVFGAVLGPLLVERLEARAPAISLPLQQIARCVVVAAAAVAVAANAPVAVWVALVWIDAATAAAYRPLQSMLLPALIRSPNELSAVAGTIPASKALAQATGALAGSVALATMSPATVLDIAAVLFALTAALVAPLRKIRTVRSDGSPPGGGAGARSKRFGATRTGFEMVVRKARPLLLLGGTRSITRGLWTSLAVVASIQLLHRGRGDRHRGRSGRHVLRAAEGRGRGHDQGQTGQDASLRRLVRGNRAAAPGCAHRHGDRADRCRAVDPRSRIVPGVDRRSPPALCRPTRAPPGWCGRPRLTRR